MTGRTAIEVGLTAAIVAVDVELGPLAVLQARARQREPLERGTEPDAIELGDARGGERGQHRVDRVARHYSWDREVHGDRRPRGDHVEHQSAHNELHSSLSPR